MARDAIDQISDILEDYGRSIADELQEVTKSVTNEGAKKLKGSSPKRTGKYAKAWKARMEKEGRAGAVSVVHGRIYNDKPTYRLTHLLEHGHAKRGGGRTRAFPHIAEVNDWAQREVITRLKEAIE